MNARRLFCLCLAAVLAALTSWPEVRGQPGMRGKGGRPPGIRALAFSPDGQLLAVAAGEPEEVGEATVWDLATRKPRFVHREARGTPSIVFSPDGKTLAVGTFTANAHLLDVTTGAVRRTLPGHGESARGVAFSPDGNTLAVSSYDRSIRLWDVGTAKVRLTLTGHQDWVYAVAFSPDGKRLASSSSDNTVKLWDLDTGRALQTHRHGSIVRRVAFTHSGRWLFNPSWDGFARIRDVKTGAVRASLNGSEAIACTPDSRLWAVSGPGRTVRLHQVALRDTTDEELARIRLLLRRLDEEGFDAREAATRELAKVGPAAEPELRKAMKEAPSAEVRMRARRLRKVIRSPEPSAVLHGHTAEVECVEFSPDGRLLVSGGKDGTVRLWDVAMRKEIAVLALPR